MNGLPILDKRIPAMSLAAVDNVRKLEAVVSELPQTHIETQHLLHAGLYARTICVPAGVVLTGAFIRIPTTLIVSGECTVYLGDKSQLLIGHSVLPASGHRKQAFVAHQDTHLTMVFATGAHTVEEAEEQFTNEAHLLFSRKPDAVNHIVITGE